MVLVARGVVLLQISKHKSAPFENDSSISSMVVAMTLGLIWVNCPSLTKWTVIYSKKNLFPVRLFVAKRS